MVSCLTLPKEILCWAINSVILSVVLAYLIQATVTGVWPWDSFVKFLTPSAYFYAYAFGSLIAVYVIAGIVCCLKRCHWSRCLDNDDDDETRRRRSQRERRRQQEEAIELISLYTD